MPPHLTLVLNDHALHSVAWSKAVLRRFLAKTSARIISFYDAYPAIDIQHYTVENWRSVLPYRDYFALWEFAYEDIEQLFCSTDVASREIILPFFHLFADYLLRASVLQSLIANENVSLALLLPPDMAPVVGGFESNVCRQAPMRLRALPANIRVKDMLRLTGRILQWPFVSGCSHFLNTRQTVQSVATPATRPAILIAVDDGPSAVNGRPAVKIAAAIHERDEVDAIVITTSSNIIGELDRLGIRHISEMVSQPLSPIKLLADYRHLRKALFSTETQVPRSQGYPLFRRILQGLMPQLILSARRLSAALQRIHAETNIIALLAVNEGFPVCISAINWAKSNSIPSIGYWPALLGKRPDCRYFPADRHLVYGDQIKDVIGRSNVTAEQVRSVGSITFDDALGRSKFRDLQFVRHHVLKHWYQGDQLVVIATEALPRPLEEIGPVVRALAEFENVHIAIKVHPADSLEFYERFATSTGLEHRIEVLGTCPLNAVLNAADLLICVLSNIIISAAQLGTPTLVCDFSEKRTPLDFVKEGLCLGCFEQDRLTDMLRTLLSDSEERRAAIRLMKDGILRFNAYNDGQSHQRVIEEILNFRSLSHLTVQKLLG